MITNVVKKDEQTSVLNSKDPKILEIIGKIDDLPVLPPLAIKILERTKDPNFVLDELIDLIMMDPVLTAKMVRIVNSVYFGLRRRVDSLREALVFLGIKEIKNVVLTTTLLNTASKGKNSDLLKRFWEYSFATAVVSKLLAKSLNYKDYERAYLSGLLHDIGELILIHNFPNEFDRVLKILEESDDSIDTIERQVLNISHLDFGPWLLEQWNYFGDIAHVVSRHHNPDKAIFERHLVAIVNLAGIYCQNHGFGFGCNIPKDIEMSYGWEIIKSDISPNAPFDTSVHIKLLDENFKYIQEIVSSMY